MRFICVSLLALLFGLLFLGGKKAPAKPMPYSFTEEPFINPRIIKDMSCGLSDGGDQVAAVNLLDSQKSDRYFGDVKVTPVKGENPFVSADDKEKDEEDSWATAHFGYQCIGRTTSGIHVLFTSESGGGSGVFEHLMFVRFERDYGASREAVGGVLRLDRERLLIRKLGEIPLGDRYDGKVELRGDQLFIGKDVGYLASVVGVGSLRSEDQVVTLDFAPSK